MSKRTKIILGISILVILLGLFYSIGNAGLFPPAPEDDSCCQNGWWELWHISNSKYCGGGDYYLWHCRELNGKDVIYASVCISGISKESYLTYFPIIVK